MSGYADSAIEGATAQPAEQNIFMVELAAVIALLFAQQ